MYQHEKLYMELFLSLYFDKKQILFLKSESLILFKLNKLMVAKGLHESSSFHMQVVPCKITCTLEIYPHTKPNQMLKFKLLNVMFQVGESVLLKCDYDLQSEKLYSLKWYKDNHEFYRYLSLKVEAFGLEFLLFPIVYP